MPASLRDDAVRATYLEAYRATGYHSRAAEAAGVEIRYAYRFRASDAEFRAACEGLDRERMKSPATPPTRWSMALQQAFLVAFAANGSVRAAAISAGITIGQVYKRRAHDADFAANWAAARNQALDRIEDALFESALSGFIRTETVGGVVKTVVAQRPDAMFRLLASRRAADRPGVRTIEVTPALLAAARAKLEYQFRIAAESGSADRAIAALPTPRPGTLPPATVTES